MIQKDTHELNHYNRQLSSSSSDSNEGVSSNQKVHISLAGDYKALTQKLDPISECSNSETKDSLGSALNKHESLYNQFNHKGKVNKEKNVCPNDQDTDCDNMEAELLCSLDEDQTYGTTALAGDRHQNGASPQNQYGTAESSNSSVANGSLVSGGSLSSLPAILAGHLKEEMNLEDTCRHLSQYQ